MHKETSLNREIRFETNKPKKIITCFLRPNDFSDTFVSFFKEFGWKLDDCLDLTITQLTSIVEIFIKQNTPKKQKVVTKDKNITILEEDKQRSLEENRRIKQLVEKAEKDKGRRLSAVEMNKLLKKI